MIQSLLTIFLHTHQLVEISTGELKFCWKKMIFSKKKSSLPPLELKYFSFSVLVRLLNAHILIWVIVLPGPLNFPQIAKNRFSGKSKTTKVCFRTFPDLWRHSYFLLCAGYWNRLIALMKLFSLGRTDLAVSSKLPTPVGIAKCRRTIIVLRTSVMVWYTWRSPWTVVSRTASSRVRR